MKLQFFAPHPLLAPFVAHIWTVESPGYSEDDIRTIVPNGRMKLVFPFRGSLFHGPLGQPRAKNPESSLWLLGTSNRPSVVDSDGPFGVLTVEFHPGAAYRFFGIPLGEMTNRVEPLADVLGTVGRELQDRLADEATPTGRVRLVQHFLLSLMENPGNPDVVVDHAVRWIQERKGLLTVAEMSQKSGYSQRYLSMKFDRFVGLSPKTLAEITRFQNRFGVLTRYGHAAVSLDSDDDYYDQSHFIKEFKRFVGLSPGVYTKSRHEFLRFFHAFASDFSNPNGRESP